VPGQAEVCVDAVQQCRARVVVGDPAAVGVAQFVGGVHPGGRPDEFTAEGLQPWPVGRIDAVDQRVPGRIRRRWSRRGAGPGPAPAT
jgi:hypothetical protein